MFFSNANDTQAVKDARQAELGYIKQWVDERLAANDARAKAMAAREL